MASFAEIAARPTREGWICDTPATLDDALERMLVATREAIRLANLGYRWNRRFWQRSPGNWEERHIERLGERRRNAIRIAEYAGGELTPLWDQYSRALSPLAEIGVVCVEGYIGPAGGEADACPVPYARWISC